MSAPLILATNSIKDTGFNVANSYFIGDDAKTSVTNTTPTNTKIFTISFWIKMHEFPTSGGDRPIFGYFSDSNNQAYMYLRNDGTLGIFENESGNTKIDIRTTQVLRDPGAFYNIIMAIDTSQGTAANRLKLYINGSQVSAFAAENYPAQDYASQWNENSLVFHVGGTATNDGNHVKGTFCEFAFIDGQQLDQTSFGVFDEDDLENTLTVFKPIALSTLTFGNNGFLLEFKQTGTSANSSGIGADTSGNNRHHSVTNIVATDQRTDTCTNNFATYNSILSQVAGVDGRGGSWNGQLAEGNLSAGTAVDTYNNQFSTFGLDSGKWYAEFKMSTTDNNFSHGIVNHVFFSSLGSFIGQSTSTGVRNIGYYSQNGQVLKNNSAQYTGSTYGVSGTDVISIALDLDNNFVYFAKNGTFQNSGNPASGSSGTGGVAIDANTTWFLGSTSHSLSSSGLKISFANFGNPPTGFTISSGNSDGEGFGNFEFAVPSGYFAICSKNLSEYGG